MKTLSKLKIEIPVILMSGDYSIILKENAAVLGLKGCIAKPFSLDNLLIAVRKVLAGGRSRTDTEQSSTRF